jgi:hypothetical protein
MLGGCVDLEPSVSLSSGRRSPVSVSTGTAFGELALAM